jgi:hypothetical protein
VWTTAVGELTNPRAEAANRASLRNPVWNKW